MGFCMRRVLIGVLLFCIPAVSLSAQDVSDWAGRLVTLDSVVPQTTLQSIGADRQIVFQSDLGAVPVPAGELVCWGGRSAMVRGSLLLLQGENLLAGEIVQIDAERVTLFSDVWGELVLPRKLLRAIVPVPSGEPGRRQRELDRLRVESAESDCLFPVNGDRLRGNLLRADGLGAVFQTDRGQELSLDWRRVASLLLKKRAPSRPRRAAFTGWSASATAAC